MASDWTYGSLQDMTNGGSDDLTDIDVITGLGSSLVSVQVLFYLFSTNSANSALLLQLGDSGGYETSGYTWSCSFTSTTQVVTNGFLHSPDSGHDAADTASGVYDIWRYNDSANLWFCRFCGNETTKNSVRQGSGVKTLSGNLTKIQATTTNGTATFDGGTIIARYR